MTAGVLASRASAAAVTSRPPKLWPTRWRRTSGLAWRMRRRSGLTPDRLYLVEGTPGTGKTTLSLQFLLAGIAAALSAAALLVPALALAMVAAAVLVAIEVRLAVAPAETPAA